MSSKVFSGGGCGGCGCDSCCCCPQGPQGAKGEKGEKGEKGDTGAAATGTGLEHFSGLLPGSSEPSETRLYLADPGVTVAALTTRQFYPSGGGRTFTRLSTTLHRFLRTDETVEVDLIDQAGTVLLTVSYGDGQGGVMTTTGSAVITPLGSYDVRVTSTLLADASISASLE